jgi:hypothetical protein
MTDAWALAISKICELIILLIQDQPPEERRANWRRWYKFWAPVWKTLGLDVSEDPVLPEKPK